MKAMTKRFLVMMMAVMMIAAMTACFGKKDDETTGADTTTEASAGDTTAGAEDETAADDGENNGDGTTAEDNAGEGEDEDHTEEQPEGEEDIPVADADLSDILSQMYEKVPTVQEIALGDPMPIDLTGEDFSYWLGVTDATGIKSAIYSEPMMSSVAYSVCLIEAEEGADIDQLKEDIFNKVNAVKWLCVTAEKVLVTNSDNTILLVMTNAEVTDELYNAFSEVMSGNVGQKLERDGE